MPDSVADPAHGDEAVMNGAPGGKWVPGIALPYGYYTVDTATRSRMMSKIRSRSLLDEKLHNYLKGHKIKHKMYPEVPGSPDALVYPDLLIFIDGCFWHSCPRCGRTPDTDRAYWVPKLKRTVKRDRAVTRRFRKEGWSVYREWEHRFRRCPQLLMNRIARFIEKEQSP
jgi:DNA mismatch endonuclease (patch repair protein)